MSLYYFFDIFDIFQNSKVIVEKSFPNIRKKNLPGGTPVESQE